jgi:hypothetical protein
MKYFEDKFWLMLILAVTAGCIIGWIDSGPRWNDTGITIGMIVLSSMAFGIMAKRRVWLYALVIGLLVTSFNFILHNNLQSAMSIAFALAGAYSGVIIKKLIR